MATTTNYSWTTPDDTALVKDGAAAIRSLGTAIDTTVFNNASAAIAKTIVDAKGDIIAATAADTVSRLAVGANNTVLTADSSTATGLKWATPSASTPTFAGCMLYKKYGITLSNNTFTTLDFTDSEFIDTDAYHNDTNASRITIPSGKAGKYKVFGGTVNDTGTGPLRARIAVNGTAYSELRWSLAGDDNATYIDAVIDLAVGDYVEFIAYQNSGGNNSVYGSNDLGIKGTYFGAYLLGA